MSLREVESAVRCVLYPDTTTCGLSSTPDSPNPASSCRLLIREPALQVYLNTGELMSQSQRRTGCGSSLIKPCLSSDKSSQVTSVSIPGHGVLQAVATETDIGSDRRTVVQFLGVPYAHPPIGALRFEAAQPADWTGTWDATKPR